MNSLEKIVWSQDSYFKTEAKNSGETSINLSNEIYEFLGGKNGYIVFTLYKEDYLKAIGVISNMLPLYTSTSKSSSINHYSNTLVEMYYNAVKSKFGDNNTATYKVNMFKREDGRVYLKELKDSDTDFNLRTFLIQAHSKLVFSQSADNEEGKDHLPQIPTPHSTYGFARREGLYLADSEPHEGRNTRRESHLRGSCRS